MATSEDADFATVSLARRMAAAALTQLRCRTNRWRVPSRIGSREPVLIFPFAMRRSTNLPAGAATRLRSASSLPRPRLIYRSPDVGHRTVPDAEATSSRLQTKFAASSVSLAVQA